MPIQNAAFKISKEVSIQLPYTSYKPRGQEEPYPLILYLHGVGERGTNPDILHQFGPNTYAAQQGENFPFVLVSPQCPPDSFWVNELLALDEFLAHLLRTFNIDPDRVYLTGNSMGGYGVWQWAAAKPHHWAAIAPICGGGAPWMAARFLTDIPVWAFHGDADDAVDIGESERMVAAVQRGGGDARLTIYEGVGHDSWTQTYLNPALYEWFLSHERKLRD